MDDWKDGRMDGVRLNKLTEVSHLIKKSIYLEYIMFSIRKNFAALRGFFAVLREIAVTQRYTKNAQSYARLVSVRFPIRLCSIDN